MARLAHLALIALTASLAAAGCATDDYDGDYEGDAEDLVPDAAADQEFGQATQDGKADGVLGYQAVAKLAKDAGVACTGERIAIAVAVAKAESGFRTNATNTAGNAHGVDRGLWQINSYWHPNVSAACAFSPSCNAKAMANISAKGTKWSPWWTYVNRKHVPYMASARAAQRAVCGD